MAASFVASFVVFTLVGIFTLITSRLPFTDDPLLTIIVFIFLFTNAAIYYYFAAWSELDVQFQQEVANKPRFEWFIRIFNNFLLFSLWLSLSQGWPLFGLILLLIYITYIIWDVLTWSYAGKRLVWFDGVGLLVTLALLVSGYALIIEGNSEESSRWYFLFGGAIFLYLPIAGIVIWSHKFNPFRREYWHRPKIR